MNILSLFDGMSCGNIAMINAGIKIDRYVAYEIDKYAIQATQHNFPYVEQMGDVFKADFTAYKGFDFVVGGSPCTYWSIAQTKNRETVASGMGWELFSQYVRAIKEAQPKYFIYENNKSMSDAIRKSITETFGFEPICINSALVSAQNRQRLYWVGIRNEHGTYDKADVKQPDDKGILLRDILDSAIALRDKGRTVISSCGRTTEREYFIKNQSNMVAERIPNYPTDKSRPLSASYCHKGDGEGTLKSDAFPDNPSKQVFDFIAEPVNTTRTVGGGGHEPMVFDTTDKQQISYNGKDVPIYQVKDGQITIKGKQYPIKLKDGYYIIRKLTVSECKRLQTVPEWYEFPISNSQAYKCLGNGWTCDVITHLIKSALENGKAETFGQLSMEI